MKNFALIAVLAVLTLGATVASAKDPSNSASAVKALAQTPAAELPAAAAKLVTSAPKQDQALLVGAVIRKVARTHPVALRHVVAALSKADPALAPIAAAAAAQAHPESMLASAAAACNAAPDKAPEIVAYCSHATAADRVALANAVAESSPVFFSADVLGRQSTKINVTSDAAVVTGGTVTVPLNIPPGSVGLNLKFEPVTTPPTPIGPGRPGFDPDRYGSAGQ